MKGFIALGLIGLVVVGSAVGLLFVRSGLDYLPGSRWLTFEYPQWAFAMADDATVVIDQGGRRMLQFDDQAGLLWLNESTGLFGRVLAAARDGQGPLYVIDQVPADAPAARFERLVRVGADGKPAGVVLQKRFEATGGFVPGALCQAGDVFYYLYADSDGLVNLASFDTRSNTERSLSKTEWSLPQASLALDPQNGALLICAAGGLLRFDQGRFERLDAYRAELAYCTGLQFGPDGRLFAADGLQAVVAELDDEGYSQPIFRQTVDPSAGQAIADRAQSPRRWLEDFLGLNSLQQAARPTVGLDYFSLTPQGFLTVDQANGLIRFFMADGQAGRVVKAVQLDSSRRLVGNIAWSLLLLLAFTVLLLLVLGILRLLLRSPAVPAMLMACLAPLLLIAMVLFFSMFDGRIAAAKADQRQVLAELQGTVRVGASLLDLNLTAVRLKPPHDPALVTELAARLDQLIAAADQAAGFRATLYYMDGSTWVSLADSWKVNLPGTPYRAMSRDYAERLVAGGSVAYIQPRPNGHRYLAAAAVRSSEGLLPLALELSLPAAELRLASLALSVFRDNRLFILFVLIGFGLLLVSVALFAGLRLSETPFDNGPYLPVPGGLSDRPFQRAGLSLPDEFGQEPDLADEDLNVLLHETHFDFETAANAPERAADGSPLASGLSSAEPRVAAAGDEFDMAFPTPDLDDLPDLPDLPSPDSLERPTANVTAPTRPEAVAAAPAIRPVAPTAIPAPEEYKRRHQVAIEALRGGDYAQAASLLEGLVAAQPDDSRAWNNLGIAYKRLGRIADAIAAVEKALSLEPGNDSTRRNLAALRALHT